MKIIYTLKKNCKIVYSSRRVSPVSQANQGKLIYLNQKHVQLRPEVYDHLSIKR